MKTSSLKVNQQGIGHIVLVVIIVAVLGVIGFAGWKIVSSRKSVQGAAAGAVSKAALEAACTEADKRICKFQASWKVQPYYTAVTKTTEQGKTSESTYQAEGDKKYHIVAAGDVAYEVIFINGVTYTKASNGVWWKQNAPKDTETKYKQDFSFDDSKDSKTSSDEPASKTTYTYLATEACGKLTCYKYQIVDSSSAEEKQFVWFDTKDYQLRKTRNETSESVTESTFNYDKISINVPSPVKELGPNQYLVPGEAEPQTLPDASSLQNSLNSMPTANDSPSDPDQ